MSFEDNENIYVIEEEREPEMDRSPLNYAATVEEETEEEPVEDDESKARKRTAFGLLFQIMFNPVEGWKKLRRSKIKTESLQSGCFYPLLALLAISNFADFFYLVNVGLTEVVTKAIVAFVAFFFAYFCIPVILSWVLPKEVTEKFEGEFGRQYTLIALSSLVLFTILTNVLPMLWPILIFLPIWTLYLMFKGVRFFILPPKQEMKFFILSGVAVIGTPLLIDYVLNTVMPY